MEEEGSSASDNRQAARRRARVKKGKERRAFWHANVRARGLNRGQLISI